MRYDGAVTRSAQALALALASLAACAGPDRRPPAEALPAARAVQLARVRCLLVAPLENASDEPLLADAATGALLSAIDTSRTRVYPVDELRALFRGTPLELPEGVSASLALELGELLAADAVLYGAVEGRTRGADADVTLSLRLAAAGVRDTLFSQSVRVVPGPDESLADASRRAALQALEPIQARMGVPGRKVCFERQRLDRVRLLAQGGERPPPVASRVTEPLPPAPAPARPSQREDPARLAPVTTPVAPVAAAAEAVAAPLPAPPTVATLAAPVPAAVEPPGPPPAPHAERAPAPAPAAPALTPRQRAWAGKLRARERFVVEDVRFAGRSPRFEQDAGLADLAAALAAAPGARIRIEGFVDATKKGDQDRRESMELARVAGRRLFDLGVARERVTWAGRGGDSPVAPNFTARGRASNRRVEVTPQ